MKKTLLIKDVLFTLFLLSMVIGLFSLFLWKAFWEAARPEEVKALVEKAQTNDHAKAAVYTLFKKSPSPNIGEIRDTEKIVDKFLIQDLSQQVIDSKRTEGRKHPVR